MIVSKQTKSVETVRENMNFQKPLTLDWDIFFKFPLI